MNGRQLKQVARLRRRRDFLAGRVSEPGRRSSSAGDFDKSELVALSWAIDILAACDDELDLELLERERLFR